jgi:uncharacterized protein YyaL (SSP411 family)
MDVLMASPTEPLEEHRRRHQLTRMYEGLHHLETADNPSNDDWECVSDAVMIMSALLKMGAVQDPDGLIEDSMEALGRAGYRSMQGAKLRLDGPSIGVIRSLLEDYSAVLEALPARTMLCAHRMAEKAVGKIIGRRK